VLGEDVAEPMEILLTKEAHAALPEGRYACAADTLTLGNLVLPYYRYQRSLLAGTPA
jgi:adenylate cyclase